MIKAIPCDGYNLHEPSVSLVRFSQRGLIGADRQSLLKRASAEFASEFDRVQLHPGDVAAHLIIVGATEVYGPNRNKDGFSKRACQEFHPTFVKFGHCYRNHKNKDPLQSYGYVKLSHYNPRMHRIELLAIYNGTKEAAARNRGLVADLELNDLESVGQFPTSMACKLPFDHCSHCGNAARSREEYCTGVDEGGQCKAGGLKNNIGAITSDPTNPILHADNREKVAFFDASRVPRQADLIAYALGITKSASISDLRDGVSLAQALQLTAPIEILADAEDVRDAIKVARLAVAEEARLGPKAQELALAFTQSEDLSHWASPAIPLQEKLAALAAAGTVAPVAGFLAMVRGKVASSDLVQKVRSRVPGSLGRLLDDQEMFIAAAENRAFEPDSRVTKAGQDWASKLANCNVTNTTAVRRRIASAVLEGSSLVKHAAVCDDAAADELAKYYAVYKLAFLRRMQNSAKFDLVTSLTIAQN